VRANNVCVGEASTVSCAPECLALAEILLLGILNSGQLPCAVQHGALRRSTPFFEPRSERNACHVRHAWQFYLPGHSARQRHHQTCGRVQNAQRKAGCTVKEIYWTQGQFDNVMIMDAPDDAR